MAAKRSRPKGQSYIAPSRAELEAMKEQKLRLLPNGEAGRRERKLLEHYGAAKEDLQWIVDNNAWTQLGFDTFTAWYAARVRPAVAAAGLRPTQEFALYVLENVQSDEAAMPKQQRLLQRELADLVGVSVSTLRRLSQDPSQASNDAGVDLDDPADPDPADVAPAVTQMLTEAAANTVSVGTGISMPATRPDPGAPCWDAPDVAHCAGGCGTPIPMYDQNAGTLRCTECDPIHEHRAVGVGLAEGHAECEACTRQARIATRTAAVTAESPTEPVASGLGGEPANVEKAAALAGTPTGPTSPGPVGDLPQGGAHGRGLSDPEDSPAAELIEPSHAGVPAVGDQTEERIEEESGGHMHVVDLDSSMPPCVVVDGLFGNWQDDITCPSCLAWFISGGRTTDPSAAAAMLLPDGEGDPTPEPEQQPGQDSPPVADHPVATPGPAEIDHHQESGVSPGGVPPEMPSVMAGELGDGGGTSLPPPSSSDPEMWESPAEALVALFRGFVNELEGVDHAAIGPELTGIDVYALQQCRDRLVEHVALFEKYATS